MYSSLGFVAGVKFLGLGGETWDANEGGLESGHLVLWF